MLAVTTLSGGLAFTIDGLPTSEQWYSLEPLQQLDEPEGLAVAEECEVVSEDEGGKPAQFQYASQRHVECNPQCDAKRPGGLR